MRKIQINISFKRKLVLMPKFRTGKMTLGIGAKKPLIGVLIGRKKKKNICIRNMFPFFDMREILSVV
jgi:hypothetical protein